MKYQLAFNLIKSSIIMDTGKAPWKIILSTRIYFEVQNELSGQVGNYGNLLFQNTFVMDGIVFETDSQIPHSNIAICYDDKNSIPYGQIPHIQVFNFEDFRLGKITFKSTPSPYGSVHTQVRRWTTSQPQPQVASQTNIDASYLKEPIKTCSHVWKEYIGFTRRDYYCEKCKEKKDYL